MRLFVLFSFIVLVSLVSAQCENRSDAYELCVLKCEEQFSESFEFSEKADCISKTCSQDFENLVKCEQGVLTDLEQESTQMAVEEIPNSQPVGLVPFGLIVFLVLAAAGVFYYLKTHEKKPKA